MELKKLIKLGYFKRQTDATKGSLLKEMARIKDKLLKRKNGKRGLNGA